MPFDLVIPFQGIQLLEIVNTPPPIHTPAPHTLLLVAEDDYQSKCSSLGNSWINYGISIQWNIVQSTKKQMRVILDYLDIPKWGNQESEKDV